MRNFVAIGICIGVISVANTASAADMKPIQEYIAVNDFETNPKASEYVFLRCSSLFILIGQYLEQDEKLKGMSGTYTKAGEKFLTAALDGGANISFARDQLKRMSASYKERWLEAKATSGNFSDDPVIKSDFQVCTALGSRN